MAQYTAGQKVKLVHCGPDLSGLVGEVMNIHDLKGIIVSCDDPSLTVQEVEEEINEGKIFVAVPPYDGKESWPLAFFLEQLEIVAE